MSWRDSVLAALRRFAARHGSRNVDRQAFLREELARMSAEVQSEGKTPHQTVSRVLQELRDEGLIEFIGSGSYLLTDQPIDVEADDLPDEAIDVALQRKLLRIGCVNTGTDQAIVRIRRGQSRVRALTISNYQAMCAVCDVSELQLLIASHVVGWAEAPEHRGNLANVICLCRFHAG
jgi:predicted restriction endonuclease